MLAVYVFNTAVAIFEIKIKEAENFPLTTPPFISLSPHIKLQQWLKLF
jgi:hypothetical protein